MNLVDAQQARRILDRLVGYSISPLLWQKVKKGLSAGRVQSIALWLIIEREKAIKNFTPEEYWSIDSEFKKGRSKFKAAFYGVNGKKKDLPNNEAVQAILKQLDPKGDFDITKVTRRERKRQPQPPFTTSTMQQEANRKLNFRTRKTMMAAQQLYEGINIGKEGSQGLITYMRTDSTEFPLLPSMKLPSSYTKNTGKNMRPPNQSKVNCLKAPRMPMRRFGQHQSFEHRQVSRNI